ncbi:beta-ribofuranosylaminobenzene 5'-phosphate synthase family protein [Halorubellus sp. PRR65]|uniref:beta-ribofuranosylaminobenzene 5'-phosphate synthase family protein n=1 Tax=Halorubellus sp. PRR65 TaxID=3098148 RepID=UPI002B25E4B4|nr:beta-ribofuranosylaminobenzene 5'-phosphate synthase family protein [Halorubellus sp. PRR65]
MVTVSSGARLHFGFQNLSLAHDRLYGGVGVGLAEPRVAVSAVAADAVAVDAAADATPAVGTDERADLDAARRYAERAVEILGVDGAHVTVERTLPRHVGLGSGTQLALATYTAVARANDVDPRPREHAPALGRGGRSGVGVATFESGGFVVDAGHPTARFTTDEPARGEWETPPVVARHALPDDWRFVLGLPDADAGRNGDAEAASMRSVVERADGTVADAVAGALTRTLLPAAATDDRKRFADGMSELGHRNGAWYADEQGGVFRPPVGEIVESLSRSDAVGGVGQSSWGPAVYALTDTTHVDSALDAARNALDAADVDGDALAVAPATSGARITD